MKKISRRAFIKSLGIGAAALTIQGGSFFRHKKLNFVFILIDDLGWRDLSCYGSTFYETPNIDRLANEGMIFTNAYAAAPVCSPTRASIFTGKYPARLKITDWIGSGKRKGKLLPAANLPFLPREEVTFAEVFKKNGYSTCFIGKWHLGYQPFYPQYQGFDINIGGHEAGEPGSYFYPYKHQNSDYFNVPGLEDGKEGEYLTDRLTDEALKFIDSNVNKPFLLFLSHYAVHTPLQSKEELTKKYKQKAKKIDKQNREEFVKEHNAFTKQIQDNPKYAGMVQSVDESVGRILDKLHQLGIENNTAIIFMSDNGGLSTLLWRWSATSNLPLRAGKGWLYEGGIREPMIVKLPGKVMPGSVCDVPVISTDFYPTMLEMAGFPLLSSQHKDGVSLIPLLYQQGSIPRQAVYWHYPHYHDSGSKPSGAIRVGDYKLIEWFEDVSVELYNLKEDISEKNNLADKMLEKVSELKQMLYDWRIEVGALVPRPKSGSGKKSE